MQILVVEDDNLQGEWLCEELERIFAAKPRWVTTESEFRKCLSDLQGDPPDVAIIDVMLPWTTPSPDMEGPPPDATDIFAAGLRCAALLADRQGTSSIPVILYSILVEEDLRAKLKDLPDVTHLSKRSDIDPLVRLVRKVTGLEQQ